MLKNNLRLYCFSPLVMLTTFFIELVSSLYLLFRYRTTKVALLITSLLGFLAFFQFAEYMVCEQTIILSSLDWARLGYVAITLLPPLGMHLGMTIAQKGSNRMITAAYGSAAVFITFFLFVGHGMQGEQCLGNYVIFSIAPYASIPYGFYYYGWLFTAIYYFFKSQTHITNIAHKQALTWLIVGYLSFIVPTFIVNITNTETLKGIPSIMCGFAILLALCLVFKVAPLVLKEKHPKEIDL